MGHTESQFASRTDATKLPTIETLGESAASVAVGRDIWVTRALLACGLIAPLVTVTLIAVMASRTPGYRHVSDTVSDLAAQGVPDAGIMMAGIAGIGLLINLFACGLSRVFARGGLAICGSLALFGSSGALSGLAQDYSEEAGAPRNLEGFLHNTFTIIAVAALITAMLLVARASQSTPGWQRMKRWSIVTSIGVAVGGLIFLVAPESIQGLVQRAIYFFGISWLVATAITALLQTRQWPGDPKGSPESSA